MTTTISISRADLDFLRGVQIDESARLKRRLSLHEITHMAVTALAEKRAAAEMAKAKNS